MGLAISLENCIIRPTLKGEHTFKGDDELITNIKPRNGRKFVIDEILDILDCDIVGSYYSTGSWIFIDPRALMVGKPYNYKMSEFMKIPIYGTAVCIRPEDLASYFYCASLKRYETGKPVDSEFSDDKPYAEADEDERYPEYIHPDTETEHHIIMKDSMSNLFGKVWNIYDCDEILRNLFDLKDKQKTLEHLISKDDYFEELMENFHFWFDDVNQQWYLIHSVMKQLAFCEQLYDFRVKHLDDTSLSGDKLYRYIGLLAEYINYLRNFINNRRVIH